MERIAGAVASLSPLADIICLQEVETTSLRATVAHPLAYAGQTQLGRFMAMLDAELARNNKTDAYEAYYFPAHSYRLTKATHAYTTGLAVLAHKDFTVDHHNAEEPADITARHLHPIQGLKQTRICAHVRFRGHDGQTVDIFNTHLSLPSTMTREFWTLERRLGYGPNQLVEAKNLAKFVAKEKASERFLVAGDFNALPGSPVYRHLVREAGYTDAFAQLHNLSEDELRSWPTAGFMAFRMHLDHMFSGPGLTWLDFEGSHPYGDRTSGFCALSDHVPMIGRCQVNSHHEKLSDGVVQDALDQGVVA